MPFGLGIWELAILGAVLALLFGAKGVPHAARRLGRGVREVKDAVADVDPRRLLDDRPAPPPGETARGDADTAPPPPAA